MSIERAVGSEPGPGTIAEPFELRVAPGHLLRRLQQAHRETWSRTVPGDLTSAQFAVLSILEQKPGIDQRMLGELAGMDRSTTAEIVRRLTARRLLLCVRDAGDGRRNLLRLTDQGVETLREAVPAAHAVSEHLVHALSERERAEFVRLLNIVVDSTAGDID